MNKLTKLLAGGVMEWEIKMRRKFKAGNATVTYKKPLPAIYIDGKFWRLLKNWNPLEDWNDCMMLVEKMEKDGFDWEMHHPWSKEDDYFVQFASPEIVNPWIFSATEDNFEEAICKAIAKARGIEYE